MYLADLKKKTIKGLMDLANILREDYEEWKKVHPNQQDEEKINEFLLIKEEIKSKGVKLNWKKTSLDTEAKAFTTVGKIQPIPFVPSGVTTFEEPYAPVYPSGNEDGKLKKLKELEPYMKDFIIASPIVWFVGGIAEHPGGSKNDADMLISLPTEKELKDIINFRLTRMFPEKIRDQVHLLFEDKNYVGPFTDNLKLFRLKLERIPDAEIEKMAEISLRVKGAEKLERQANIARKEDKITFGDFFLPQKPMRGYKSNTEQSISRFLSLWDQSQFPVYSSKKMDGMNSEWHVSKDKTVVYTEDGTDETSSFPKAIEEISKIGDDKFILLAEIETWKDNKHVPREVTAGKVHKKEPDEDGIVINVYDIVYYKDDIHKKPYSERWEILEKFGFPQTKEEPDNKFKWNLIPHILNADKKDLEIETKRLRKVNGSEGNVAKQGDAEYDLAGKRSSSWIKFHNSFTFPAVVLDKIKTKTEGVYNIEWGIFAGSHPIPEKKVRMIKGRGVIYGGKTFSTTDSPVRGSSILIECETFNLIQDEKTGVFDISAWAPRYLGKTKEEPGTIRWIVERAKRAFCFQGKKIQDGKITYLSEYEVDLFKFQEGGVELTKEEQTELEELGKKFLEIKDKLSVVDEDKEAQEVSYTDLNFVRDEIAEFLKQKKAKRIKTKDFIFSLREVAPYFWVTSREELLIALKDKGLERFITIIEDIKMEELKNHLLSKGLTLDGLKKTDSDVSLYIYDRATEEIREDLVYLSLDKMSAELIWRGIKTAVVLPERYADFVGKHIHLVSENLDWGDLRLHLPEEIKVDQFAEKYHLHLIEEYERKDRWSEIDTLYLFSFHFTPRKYPQKIDIFVEKTGMVEKYIERY